MSQAQPYTSDQVYISGVLTNATLDFDHRNFYENIGKLCQARALKPYIPHQHTDPEVNKDIDSTVVYEHDYLMVLKSCLIIAYVGQASGGVGMEIEMARANSTPVIVLYESSVPITTISRMYRGNRAVKAHVGFANMEEALFKLEAALDAVLHQWVLPKPLFF